MYDFKLDGLDALLKKFDTLKAQLEGLKQSVPNELMAWQREDMHRVLYPNMQANSYGTETQASTVITEHTHPPGGVPQKRGSAPYVHRPKKHRIRRHAATKTRVAVRRSHKGGAHRHRRGGSGHPILRPELDQKLEERMTKLVSEAFRWP